MLAAREHRQQLASRPGRRAGASRPVAPVGLARVGHEAHRRQVDRRPWAGSDTAPGPARAASPRRGRRGGSTARCSADTVRTLLLIGGGPVISQTTATPTERQRGPARAARDDRGQREQHRAEQDREIARGPGGLDLRAQPREPGGGDRDPGEHAHGAGPAAGGAAARRTPRARAAAPRSGRTARRGCPSSSSGDGRSAHGAAVFAAWEIDARQPRRVEQREHDAESRAVARLDLARGATASATRAPSPPPGTGPTCACRAAAPATAPSSATCRRSPRTKASAKLADARIDSSTTSEYIRVSCA